MTAATLEARAEVLGSIHDLDPDEWAELCRRSGAPAFYGHEFLAAYEERPLQPIERALYVAVRTPAGELVAGVPAYVQPAADPFGVLASALGRSAERVLISHVAHCYDTWVPALRPDPATVGLVWRTLSDLAAERGVDAFGFANVAASGPLAAALEAMGERLIAGAPRYRLGLSPLQGPEDYLGLLGPSTRKTLRRYVRRAAAAGVTVAWSAGGEGDLADVLSLCEATARRRAPGYYVPAAVEALVRRLGDRCRILRLRHDGRTLAASICLVDDRRFHTWAGGSLYPPGLGFSPQYVLFFEEVNAALASGRPVLEGGRRNDEFKARHGLRPVPLVACLAGTGPARRSGAATSSPGGRETRTRVELSYPVAWRRMEGAPLFATSRWFEAMGARLEGTPLWATRPGRAGEVAAGLAGTLVEDPDAYPFVNAPALVASPASPFATGEALREALGSLGEPDGLAGLYPNVALTYPGYACFPVGTAASEPAEVTPLLREVAGWAAVRGARLVACLYVDGRDARFRSALAAAGFVGFPVTSEAELEVPDGGFEAYLAALPRRRRNRIRRDRLRIAENGVASRVEAPTPALVREAAALRAAHRRKYGLPADPEHEERRLDALAGLADGDPLVVTARDRPGALVSFVLLVRDADTWHAMLTGTDYGHPGASCAHFEASYYRPVEAARAFGVRRISFGLGAEGAKRERGCRLRPSEVWALGLDPGVHAPLGAIRAAWLERFEEEPA